MARKFGKATQAKVEKVMKERKAGTLRSASTGKKVTRRKQAIAIGLSEARRAGAKVPQKESHLKVFGTAGDAARSAGLVAALPRSAA